MTDNIGKTDRQKRRAGKSNRRAKEGQQEKQNKSDGMTNNQDMYT